MYLYAFYVYYMYMYITHNTHTWVHRIYINLREDITGTSV